MVETKKLIKGIVRTQPIASCIFRSKDFQNLYHLLSEKAAEAGKILEKEFEERSLPPEQALYVKEKMPEALRLVAFVIGTNGERVIVTDESVISPQTIPEDIKTIIIGSAYAYNILFSADPSNKFEVNLDFTRPRLLDISAPSPTPIESKNFIKVEGNNDTWVNGVYQSIVTFFQPRTTKRGWLHAQHTYDLLLLLLGIPIILWFLLRFDYVFRSVDSLASDITLIGVYLWFFVLGLFLFRLLFNFARCTFPQFEYISGDQTKPGKHRYVLYAIIIAILGSVIGDLFFKLVL
jgi:hypothetical protein